MACGRFGWLSELRAAECAQEEAKSCTKGVLRAEGRVNLMQASYAQSECVINAVLPDPALDPSHENCGARAPRFGSEEQRSPLRLAHAPNLAEHTNNCFE